VTFTLTNLHFALQDLQIPAQLTFLPGHTQQRLLQRACQRACIFMISQLNNLAIEVDGRYASDAELQFLGDYVQSFNLRLQTYQRIQELEKTLVQEALVKMRSLDPNVFTKGGADISAKCKFDVTIHLRYAAIAVLLNDPDGLQEQLLFWLQTIIRALKLEQFANLAHTVLQDIVKAHLTPPQAGLVCPILEINRRMLSAAV
jgi:hypothetical protein